MNRQRFAALGLILTLAGATLAAAPPAAPLYSGRSLDAWLADLADRDVLVREEAVLVLAAAGSKARPAVPALKKLLTHENRSLRTRAALALWRVAGEAGPAVAALTVGLHDGNASVRLQAVIALREIGSAAGPAAARVIELLDDADMAVRYQAAAALARMGRAALPGLFKALTNNNARLRHTAVDLLGGALAGAIAKDDLPALAARLDDEDLKVRVDSACILWRHEQTDKAVVAALQAGVKSTDASLRSAVLSTLAGGSRKPATLVPVLEAGLTAADQASRIQAARLLYAVEKKPRLVLPIYLEAINGNHRGHWSSAVAGLGELGEEAGPAATRFVELMKIRDFQHEAVRTTLTRIGPAVIPPVVELLKDAAPATNHYLLVQESAVVILGQLGGKAADAVAPLLGHADSAVRIRAARVLGSIGPDARNAVPKLLALTRDANFAVRDAAVASLGGIGPQARTAVPRLIELARGADANGKINALRALTRIGPDAKTAVPVCLDVLKDAVAGVRVAGLELLFRVDPGHKDLLPQALDLLKNPAGRSGALAVLSEMGPDAASAVPDILQVLKDPSDSVRRAAVDALAQIGPAARKAVPALLEQLHRPNDDLQIATIAALGSIGAHPGTTAPRLVAFIKTCRTLPIYDAIALLGEFGPRGAEGAPSLLALLEDSTPLPPQLRSSAGLALARVDPARARKDAMPLLRRLLHDYPGNCPIARALLLIDPGDKEAASSLENALKAASYVTRGEACYYLGQLGAAARKFVPRIKELRTDPQDYVRGMAALAVWRITGDAGEALPTLQAMLEDGKQRDARESVARWLGEMGAAARPAVPALLALRHVRDADVRVQVARALEKIRR